MANQRLRKLIGYIRPHRRQLLMGVLALLAFNGLSVWIPELLQSGIDREQFGYYVALILIAASAMWGIRILSRIWILGVGRKVEFDLKQALFQHLLRLEPAYFATRSSGDLITRATSDVDEIRRLLGFAVQSILEALFRYGLVVPVMFAIDLRLSAIALLPYPLILTAVWIFSARLREQQSTVQEQLSDLSELVREDISGIDSIKIYAQEQNERQAFRRRNQQLLAANLKLAQTRNWLFPVIQGLATLSLLLLLVLGAGKLDRGLITSGEFVQLIVYAQQLVFPMATLGFTLTAYQRGQVSVDRVESILNAQPRVRDAPQAQPLAQAQVRGALSARELSYTYPGASEPALQAVNFAIAAGETVAIVGPIGSGKSTLAHALPHLLEIPDGQLFLDDRDVTQIQLESLRAAIAFVPQDSFLFSTTIADNIRYGKPEASQAEIEAAARQARIHNEIARFPSQYDTVVGERGITLSGGQRQRASLARALLADAPVLVLDDALSSVDGETATEILTQLSGETADKTVVFVSHQLSVAAQADRILVMEAGRIVQVGSHAALLERPGLYRSLWEQQQLEQAVP